MTNAEKYNLTREQARELCYEIARFCNGTVQAGMIMDFFYYPLQPTLTEDERAFLSLLPFTFEKIGKDKLGCLYITYHNGENRYQYSLMPFNHLFQFIKERRRIFY